MVFSLTPDCSSNNNNNNNNNTTTMNYAVPNVTSSSNNATNMNNYQNDNTTILPPTCSVKIPGPFVVLQGMAGDGLRNTMDRLPDLQSQQQYYHDDDNNNNNNDDDVEMTMANTTPAARVRPVVVAGNRNLCLFAGSSTVTPPIARTVTATTAAPSSSVLPTAPLVNCHPKSPPTTSTSTTMNVTSTRDDNHKQEQQQQQQQEQQEEEDTYVVVGDTTSSAATNTINTTTTSTTTAPTSTPTPTPPALSPLDQQVLQDWTQSCRQAELQDYQEWKDDATHYRFAYRTPTHDTILTPTPAQARPVITSTTSTPRRRTITNNNHNNHTTATTTTSTWWMTPNGELALFSKLPHSQTTTTTTQPLFANNTIRAATTSTTVVPPPIGSLSPGMTVIGLELITYDNTHSTTNHWSHHHPPIHRVDQTSDIDDNCITNMPRLFPQGRKGWTQFLKIQYNHHHNNNNNNNNSTSENNNNIAYVVYSLDGYAFLGPGLPEDYVQRDCWLWRVTCTEGAFVRVGLDLSTAHLATIPYGAFVTVTRKSVNAMGLSRLKIQAVTAEPMLLLVQPRQKSQLPSYQNTNNHNHYNNQNNNMINNTTAMMDTSTGQQQQLQQKQQQQLLLSPMAPFQQPFQRTIVTGWCSEFLNPLSGQRGPIVQPVPYPVPALYQVTCPAGAVIRRDIELSSPIYSTAPLHTTLAITGRAFSEHPVDQCLHRMRLAGNAGWVSIQLNLPPPDNVYILSQCCRNNDSSNNSSQPSTDPLFDPQKPGEYHLQKLKERQEQEDNDDEHYSSNSNNNTSHSNNLSCISSSDELSLDAESSSSTSSTSPHNATTTTRKQQQHSHHHHHNRNSTTPRSKQQQQQQQQQQQHNRAPNNKDNCLICLSEPQTATIVHGQTGHIACCLLCARILKARGDPCPVCRTPIDMVIQHFYA